MARSQVLSSWPAISAAMPKAKGIVMPTMPA
jgi:hypothetical protein